MSPLLAGRFSIAIAPGLRPMFYDYASLVRAADGLAPSEFTLHLDGADVEVYRVKKSPSPRVEIVLAAAGGARLAADPSYRDGHMGYFDVRLDGVRRYVAIGWERIGAAAIRTPVVHAEPTGGASVLRIGAHQGAWYGWGQFGIEDAARVDAAELRAYFGETGALEVVDELKA